MILLKLHCRDSLWTRLMLMLTYLIASRVTSFTCTISQHCTILSVALFHPNTIWSVVFILLWICTFHNYLRWWIFWFQVIVSRMRYISSQTERSIRFVGLSTALANARYVSKWNFGLQFPLSAYNFLIGFFSLAAETMSYCLYMASGYFFLTISSL
jgi:hypothetical protein